METHQHLVETHRPSTKVICSICRAFITALGREEVSVMIRRDDPHAIVFRDSVEDKEVEASITDILPDGKAADCWHFTRRMLAELDA